MERVKTPLQRKSAATAQRARWSTSARAQHHESVASVIHFAQHGASRDEHVTNALSDNANSLQSTGVFQRMCNECEEESVNEVQTKTDSSMPAVSAPDDPLELQADQVANAVLAQSESAVASAPVVQASSTVVAQTINNSLSAKSAPAATQTPDQLQRMCSTCEDDTQHEEAIQKKSELPVSTIDDPLERQADQVASHVVQASPEVRQASTETLQTKCSGAPEEELQRMCSECEEDIQRKPNDDHADGARPGLWGRIKQVLHGGFTLPCRAAEFFSRRMGFDFDGVKIHTDPVAASTAEQLHARAYTYRNHVVFAANEFQPETNAGRHLIAHELTHVAQQGAALPMAAATTGAATVAASPAQIQGDWELPSASDVWDAGVGVVSSGASAVGDAVDSVVTLGADAIWSMVRAVAPQALMDLIAEVREKGFFGYIKEKVSNAASSLFGGLADQSGIIGTVLQTFGRLATTAGEIIAALVQGDCEPLFAAFGQLQTMVSELANDAWTAISDFFRPVGEFFSDLWNRFGAPVVEWLQQFAGDAWAFISGLGQQIWDWTRPVIDAIRAVVSDAWSWVKEQLGIASEDNESPNGLIQWIQGKAQEAWDAIKLEMQPVIEPVQQVIAKVQEVLPLEAILNFRETVNGWLQQAAATARNLDAQQGGDVAENQDTLRNEILPAILDSIANFRLSLIATGAWVAEKIGSAVDVGLSFVAAISSSPILSAIGSIFTWLGDGMNNLGSWARQTVQSLFQLLGDGLVRLSQFIEPILNALRRIAEVLGNILGMLPDFLLGPIWMLLPDCIKNPIKNFFVEQILNRIPLFQQLMAAGDIWARVQQTALTILRQIFVDGDLLGAAWRFFREMLGLIGIPAQLILQIIANAAQAFSDILMDPIGFLGNLLRAMWEGATRFFSNIFSHLFGGVSTWLFGQMSEAGIEPPDLSSFRSIIGFVFDLLGLTMENIWRILAEHIGQPLVDRVRGAIELASGAWEWISTAVTEGLPGIWRMIQERISNLWDTVLTSVATWVNTAIIETGMRWLMSLLDVTGITPVINSLIAIYRAIESFAQYMAQMLEIVNSVVQGIADIARGVIDSGAQYVETALADGVPIVVGFLANQFGLGHLGERVRELIEGVRERVNGALDWIITNAINLGRAFLDMVQSGVAAVRNWWEARKEFHDAAGGQHELYFQSERGEMIVESDPQPVPQFLSQLVIPAEDPQHAQKQQHKTQAETIYRDIARLRQTLQATPSGPSATTAQAELNQKIDELSVHLTPLLVGAAATAGGRIPNPLTLATLNDPPVTTPRTAPEETADLNAARQLILLAREQVHGTDQLATEYFDKIRTRFTLTEVAYQAQGAVFNVKLRAAQELIVPIDVPLRGTAPGITLASHVTPTPGTAGGDSVAIAMVADPIGFDKTDGSEPRDSALRVVMNSLVTDPTRNSESKYIKGHLLNHNIGGPGDAANMYPITGEANSAHNRRVEERVKGWVTDNHYWAYYSVHVRSITESITHPNTKHPDNFINATFHTESYIKNADGTHRDEFADDIVSNYVKQDGTAVAASGPIYQLDTQIKGDLDNLAATSRTTGAITAATEHYNSTATSRVQLGAERISVMIEAYNSYALGNLATWPENKRTSLTYVNNRASDIHRILTSPVTT